MAKRTIVHMKRAVKNLHDLAERGGFPKSSRIEDRRGDAPEDDLRRMFLDSAYPPNLPSGEFNSPLARAAGVNDISRAMVQDMGFAEGGGVDDLPQLAPPPDTGVGMWPAIKSGVAAATDFLTPDYFRQPENKPLPPEGQEGKIPRNQPYGIEAAPMLALDAAGNLSGLGLGKAAMAVGAPIAGKAAQMVRKLNPIGLYSHAAEVAEKLPQL